MNPSGWTTTMSNSQDPEPLAIVGISFRFPQDATSTESFWKMLEERRSAMTEIPAERMNINSFYHAAEERVDTVSTAAALQIVTIILIPIS